MEDTKKQEIVEKLKGIADKKAWSDDEDFMPDDYAGGNIDDAYYGGENDGRISLAREILELLK